MATKTDRGPNLLRISTAVVFAIAIVAGSYVLARSGDYAVGDNKGTKPADPTVRRTVVSDIRNTAVLDPEAAVISVPLGVDFSAAGKYYGLQAKKPVQLGPNNVKGTTKDPFGSQGGLHLPGNRLLYPFCVQLAKFPTEAPGDPTVPDGTHLSTPTLRLLDLASGQDTLVLSGVRSMAWRADGKFAYAVGIDQDYRYNMPYLQRVAVRQGLDGAAEVWTPDADRYTVLQWVGDTLLVAREGINGVQDLLALSGPGSIRQLGDTGDLFLTASPDGTRVLLSSGGGDTGEPASIRVVRVSDGATLSSLSLAAQRDPATQELVSSISGASWESDTIALSLSPADLAIVKVSGEKLDLRDLLTFQYPKHRAGSIELPLLNEAGDKVFAIVREGSETTELERTAVISYEIGSGTCTRWSTPGARTVLEFVANPSRPR